MRYIPSKHPVVLWVVTKVFIAIVTSFQMCASVYLSIFNIYLITRVVLNEEYKL